LNPANGGHGRVPSGLRGIGAEMRLEPLGTQQGVGQVKQQRRGDETGE
jgi:hypothetical protein